jgi:hypothetical protein
MTKMNKIPEKNTRIKINEQLILDAYGSGWAHGLTGIVVNTFGFIYTKVYVKWDKTQDTTCIGLYLIEQDS